MLKEGEHSAQISAQPTLAPTQGTGERSSVHHKHVRIECSWKKKGRGSSRNRDEFDSHTQGDYKCQVLQHHIVVQASLSIQGIFPDQGLNLCLCIGRWVLYYWATWEASTILFLITRFIRTTAWDPQWSILEDLDSMTILFFPEPVRIFSWCF